jgi:hypothetical protein
VIVHTTMRPDVPVKVDEAEYMDLARQGLLLPPDSTPPALGPTDAPPAPPPAPPAPDVHPERDQEQPA